MKAGTLFVLYVVASVAMLVLLGWAFFLVAIPFGIIFSIRDWPYLRLTKLEKLKHTIVAPITFLVLMPAFLVSFCRLAAEEVSDFTENFGDDPSLLWHQAVFSIVFWLISALSIFVCYS